MATIIRLTKGSFDHKRKVDQESHWQKRLQEEQDELDKLLKEKETLDAAVIVTDPVKLEELTSKVRDKEEDLEAFKKTAEKALAQIAKYGPTIWKLHCLTKKEIYKIKARYQYEYDMDKMRGGRIKKVGTDFVGYQDLVALDIFAAGFDSVENLRDADGNVIECTSENKQLIIDNLDDMVIKELSNVIAGVVEEEETKN